MPSLFKKSSPKNRWLKILAYGDPGTGKTIFALTFPQARVADMEGGTLHYQGRKVIPQQHDDFEILQTGSAMKVVQAADQTVEEFKAWAKDPEKNPRPCMSFIIDPMTKFWARLQEAYLDKMQKGDEFRMGLNISDWLPIKRPLKNLVVDLQNLPMHFVMTSHEGNEYEKSGKELTVVGRKPKVEADTPYDADTVLRFIEPAEGSGNTVFCEKDRTGVLTKGKTYSNVYFDTWKEYLKGTENFAPAPALERPAEMTEDQELFHGGTVESASDQSANPETDTLVATLINEPALKKAMDDMDWPEAKRIAMAKRFKDMESWKTFLRDAWKEHQKGKQS